VSGVSRERRAAAEEQQRETSSANTAPGGLVGEAGGEAGGLEETAVVWQTREQAPRPRVWSKGLGKWRVAGSCLKGSSKPLEATQKQKRRAPDSPEGGGCKRAWVWKEGARESRSGAGVAGGVRGGPGSGRRSVSEELEWVWRGVRPLSR
jgi:hypothetical protein